MQARHQAVMSAWDGMVLVFSMREVFALCQPHRSASSWVVSSASSRSSFSRSATDSRAAWALEEGDDDTF
ncbi:hypothetical protein K530_51295 [Streptomyces noursei CCRC 11814]|nr:hypothetical protein K530_51295 [Streptomyces noursei CCRC 11814]